jgi:hypothetical protein
LPEGGVRLARAVTRIPEDRRDLRYDAAAEALTVADGLVIGVRPEVHAFSVSGWPVVPRWLEHRMRARRPGSRASSELDGIRPECWYPSWTDELLALLRALTRSVELWPAQDDLLVRIVEGPLIQADDLPVPTDAERQVPGTIPRLRHQPRLL